MTYTEGRQTVVALFVKTNRAANKLWAKDLELKKGDSVCEVKGCASAMCWNRVYLLTSMNPPQHQVLLWIKKGMCQSLRELSITITL